MITIYDRTRFCKSLYGIVTMSKARFKLTPKGKTDMKETNEKKITTLKVYKVILIIYTCVLIGFIGFTVYGWITGAQDNNYVILAALNAIYCATAAEYGILKKKEAKKKIDESKPDQMN